jgi:hypothetical protein
MVGEGREPRCGLSDIGGRRVGLFLTRRDGAWHSGLCSQADPDELAAVGLDDGRVPTLWLAAAALALLVTVAATAVRATWRAGTAGAAR